MNSHQSSDDEIKNWFWRFLSNILRKHAENTNLEFFQSKYPGLPREAIAQRRIKAAAQSAALFGFASGAAISIAEAGTVVSALSTVASGFLASPITLPVLAVAIPVGVAAYAMELNFLLRIQLHLAYDLFVLYGLPLDMEDPEKAQDVVSVAFGIKSVEVAGQAIQKIVPKMGPILLRKSMRKGLARRKLQEWFARRFTWQFARKYLAEGALIRMLVPGIAIVTATAWDYLLIKAIGNAVRARIRRRGLAAIEADKLALEYVRSPKLVLHAVLALALTNEDLCETELRFYSRLVERLRNLYGDAGIDALGEVSSLDWDVVMADLADVVDEQEKRVIYDALAAVAIVEGQLQRKKRKRLQAVADLYGISFDEKKLNVKLAPFKEPWSTRTCLFAVLALSVLSISLCLVCWLGTLLATLQQANIGG